MLDKPVESLFSFLRPAWIAGELMHADEAANQITHALGGAAFSYSQDWAQIEREAAHALLQHHTQQGDLKSERAHEARVEAVKCVVAAVVVGDQPAGEP